MGMESTQERFEMPFKRRRRKGKERERSSSLAPQVTINRREYEINEE